MKIAIFIDNENISTVDCRNLEKGNPGVGGTEYCILLLAQIYKKFYPQDEITFIATKEGLLPEVDEVQYVKHPMDIGVTFKKIEADMLVISSVYHGEPLPQAFFDMVEAEQIKTIFWGHNFYLSDFCNRIAKCAYAKANVFVGRQQYDRYLDHQVIKKSTYIYNMYPTPSVEARNVIVNHSVTYIGSLVPTKGFHVLAQAWKKVLKAVPDAELHVIGSGKLYGRNSQLGRYGIADAEYEAQFMPGVTDGDGNILQSVHFHGVMGAEKSDIIQKTCVGVVNPTGRTETFGISALDFESLGVPVVTIAKGGFLDTVLDGETGLLYGSTDQLAEMVTTLLSDPEFNSACGAHGIDLAHRFAPDQIIHLWHELFVKVKEDATIDFLAPDSFMKSNLKQFRWMNRKIKNALHFEYPISVIGVETVARNILRRLGR